MNNWIYKLTDHEMQIATYLGKLRCETAKDDASTDDTGIKKTYEIREQQNIVACIGEIAVARMLNVCWTAMAWKEPDVAGYIEVRSVIEDWHNLIVRFYDKDNSPMVLVYVKDNICTVKGWDFVSNVKEKGIHTSERGVPYWRTQKGHQFRSMDELLSRHLAYQTKLHENKR